MTKFELEDNIMKAWCIVEDLQLIQSRIHNMSQDEIADVLKGLYITQELRMERLWSTFEKMMAVK